MFLRSLFLYLLWPLIILAGYVVTIWAIHRFESETANQED